MLRQCRLILAIIPEQQKWKAQQAESQACVELLASEIAASVPQLAGYHEQLERQRLAEEDLPLRSRPWPFKAEADEVPDDAKVTSSGIIGDDVHYSNEPGPFRKGNISDPQLARSLNINADNGPRELQVDAPTRIFPPVSAAQPASVYHLLFQLYSLHTISLLPASFKEWIQERITWLENISNPEDLARLQDMIAKSPGDGFPMGTEG